MSNLAEANKLLLSVLGVKGLAAALGVMPEDEARAAVAKLTDDQCAELATEITEMHRVQNLFLYGDAKPTNSRGLRLVHSVVGEE